MNDGNRPQVLEQVSGKVVCPGIKLFQQNPRFGKEYQSFDLLFYDGALVVVPVERTRLNPVGGLLTIAVISAYNKVRSNDADYTENSVNELIKKYMAFRISPAEAKYNIKQRKMTLKEMLFLESPGTDVVLRGRFFIGETYADGSFVFFQGPSAERVRKNLSQIPFWSKMTLDGTM